MMQNIKEILYFSYAVLKTGFTFEKGKKSTFIEAAMFQIYFSGVKALPTIFILGIILGIFLVTYFVAGSIGDISGIKETGGMISSIIIKDLTPILIGIILILRSVTATTTQLGIMRIQREIEAMELMGINPLKYLVFPRVIGGIISYFCLSVIFPLIIIFVIYFIGWLFFSLPFGDFYSNTLNYISMIDILSLFFKIIFSGLGIFMLGAYYGFSVNKASTDIPIIVSKVAIRALIYIFLVSFILSFFEIYAQHLT